MTRSLTALGILGVALLVTGCAEPSPVIDTREVFARYDWWDNRDWDWYEARIPFVETPDPQIDEVYYYRWEVMNKHLTYGSPESGYLFTEFIDRPFWSGTYGGIACPLGHQLAEVRWLKDPRIIDDFSRYWLDTPGALPRNYSNWYGSALWDIHRVWRDSTWIVSLLPYMEAQYEGWLRERFDAEQGLFHWTGHNDGMEVNINSRQTEDDWVVEGYRPTLNSYVFGDLKAMTRTASLAGRPDRAEEYASRAETLKQRVIEELWDERRQFFFHQFVSDHPPGIKARSLTYETGPFAGSEKGRELIGYVPWQFNLPDSAHSVAWKFLMDPAHFRAPFGPTTTEQQDPQFFVSPNCCVWSGQSWPYATTQTLLAMANLLNEYDQDVVDRADYFDLFKTYTATHYKEGRPYVAESANPFDGSWTGSDLPNHSEHYLHSGYIDPLLSGLLGIRPTDSDSVRIRPLIPEAWDYFAVEGLAMRGRDVAVIWDRTGKQYGRGSGLSVWSDGREIGRAPDASGVDVVIPPTARPLDHQRPANLAVNNGRRFPEITASFSAPETPPFYANDGGIWYHTIPTNRWSTEGSPNREDWIALDLGTPQTVSQVKLYFLDDGTGIRPPAAYRIEHWLDGAWHPLTERRRYPVSPAGRRANTIELRPQSLERIRALLEHAPGSFSGLSEFELWSPDGVEAAAARRSTANVALNPDGSDSVRLEASFAAEPEALGLLVDGLYGLTTYQANRWTALGTPNASDWIAIHFTEPRRVSQVDITLWGGAPRYLGRVDSTVSAPRSLSVQVYQDGRWRAVGNAVTFPDRPRAMAMNSVTFEPEEARSVRVWFEHDLPAVSGATEIQIWASDSRPPK